MCEIKSLSLRKLIKTGCFICLFVLQEMQLIAQSIYISPDINIKNDFSYFILPHPNGTISLLRDKSFKISLQTLTPEFQWGIEKSIELPGRKWRIIDLFEWENDIDIFYVSKLETTYGIYLNRYNIQPALIHERMIYDGVAVSSNDDIKIKYASNKNWMAIGFQNLSDERLMVLYNRKADSIYYTLNLTKQFQEERQHIYDVEISDQGFVYLFGRTSESNRKKVQTLITKIGLDGMLFEAKELPMKDYYFTSGMAKIDNVAGRLAYGGLYSERSNTPPEGYAIGFINDDNQMSDINFVQFSTSLLKEWSGNSKKSILSNSELNTRSIEFKSDSGCLIFYENTKELSRRPYFSATDPTGAYTTRWYDYYFDDIIVASFDKKGVLLWEKVFHKRQYSQDDQGLFSSFFIFHTNSVLRIIFNDAISSEGTVSEYILKPGGEFIRKSILNTSYKNLNLRFKDAMELDAQSVLVPSENNGKLNLVKIVFD